MSRSPKPTQKRTSADLRSPTRPHAVVVGAGINGLSAALRLARAGWRVDVYEREDTVGGHCRSVEFFPGTVSDIGAAAFPFAAQTLTGDWAFPPRPLAHPLERSTGLIDAIPNVFGDSDRWHWLHDPVTRHIDAHVDNILGPTMLRIPPHPLAMARFGVRAILPATTLARRLFHSEEARAIFVGNAVHSMSSPRRPFTASFGVLFGALAHANGWPVARGGSQTLADTLALQVEDAGGEIHTGVDVDTLPAADVVVLNMTANEAARYGARPMTPGPGVFKVDWLLREPVPWCDPRVGTAGTVHVGGTAGEIAHAEEQVERGMMPNRPFVMVCQQYAADPSRGLVLWTYAHVPNGYTGDATEHIARQIERFAPGFRDVVEGVYVTGYINDIAGGKMNLCQLIFRHPHRVRQGVYLASGSNAPGAGVHGMPGLWAAEAALRRTHSATKRTTV